MAGLWVKTLTSVNPGGWPGHAGNVTRQGLRGGLKITLLVRNRVVNHQLALFSVQPAMC